MVRDKLPGQPVNSPAGRQLALIAKLHEEAEKIARDPRNPAEYTDILEVLIELVRLNRVPWSEIEDAFLRKREENGTFRMARIMEW